MVMDSRRFDRNADQLSQILKHFRQIQGKVHFGGREIMIENAIVMIEAILDINDDLGDLAGKGLI